MLYCIVCTLFCNIIFYGVYYTVNPNAMYVYSRDGAVGRALASHAVGPGSIPCCNILKSSKHIATSPLPNAQQQVWVSRVIHDNIINGCLVS